MRLDVAQYIAPAQSVFRAEDVVAIVPMKDERGEMVLLCSERAGATKRFNPREGKIELEYGQ